MAKKKRYRHVTIHPAQGGALIGSASDDIPITDEKNFLSSSANYTEKLNFRREVDGELRREGWELFAPTGSDDAIYDQFPIRGLYQFAGSDGTPVLIAVAGPRVLKLNAGDRRYAINYLVDALNIPPTEEYATSDGQDGTYRDEYFNNEGEDFTWEVIYTFPNHMDAKEEDGTYKDPFEGGAYRWEFVELRNHLIINNGVDLPIVYKSEYSQAYPLYGLRENGIVSVGTISGFQDRLFCADLRVISSGFDTWFENAENPYGPIEGTPQFGSVRTQRYQYRVIYSAEGDPKLWNAGVESGTGSVVFESGGLPGTLVVQPDGRYTFEHTYNFAIGTEASLYQDFIFGNYGDYDHVGLYLPSDIKFDNEDFTALQREEAVKRLQSKYPTRAVNIDQDGDGVVDNPNGGFEDSEILAEQIAGIDTSGIFIQIPDDLYGYYELRNEYDLNRYSFGVDHLGLYIDANSGGGAQFGQPKKWYNQAKDKFDQVLHGADIHLGSDASVNYKSDYIADGEISLTYAQYLALPDETYGSAYNQTNSSSTSGWTKLHLGKDVFQPDLASSSKVFELVDKDQNPIKLLDNTTGVEFPIGTTLDIVLRTFTEQLHRPASIQEFAQDGSRIMKMAELGEKLVVYRDSGFFFLTAQNSLVEPFAVDPRYTGGRVADFRNTIITVSGNHHLFMGNSGVYMINRSSLEPKPVPIFELGPPFWQIVPPELSEFVYSVDNPVTREIFINCPLGYKTNSQGEYIDDLGNKTNVPCLDWGVIAYDYINETLSQMDASVTCAATIRKPKYNRVGPDELWFLMGIHQSSDDIYVGTQWREDPKEGGVLVRYGYGPPKYGETEPYRIYNRLGYGYASRIKSGLIDFGDSFSDKEVRSYVLELSSKYGVTPIRVKISTTSAPQGTEQVETMSTENGVTYDYVTLNEIRDENMIPLYLRAPYMRDEISILPQFESGSTQYIETGFMEADYFREALPVVIDNPVKLVGRTFEVSGIDTRSATQAVGQG